MQLVEIRDKNKLNNFVGAQTHAELLQSWQWGEFQKQFGNKIFRFGVEDGGKIVAVATLIKKALPLGMNYFYCPRGPIINDELSAINGKLINFLFSEIKKLAQKEGVIFLRIEPRKIIDDSSFMIRRSLDVQVSKTIILDLSKTEDKLLKEMHQKTRYNIRLAEKKGVKIREAAEGEFEKFWELMSQTVNRDGFRLHEKDYYEKMIEVDGVKLFLGEAENKILCSGIFSFFGDTAVYLHGASSNENRELMAPHILQWELARRAKALGFKYYDFFGVDEKKWPGVTRFKRGFGGKEVNYPGTFDVIFDIFKYDGYKVLRFVRRFLKF